MKVLKPNNHFLLALYKLSVIFVKLTVQTIEKLLYG